MRLTPGFAVSLRCRSLLSVRRVLRARTDDSRPGLTQSRLPRPVFSTKPGIALQGLGPGPLNNRGKGNCKAGS